MTTNPHLGRCLASLLAWLTCAEGVTQAATAITDFRLVGPDARFSLRSDPQAYYLVEWTTDLSAFHDLAMTLGDPAPNLAYRVLPMFPRLFFRGTPLDLFAPSDRDGDGIDDVYEIKNLWLNPLDPSDAGKDPDGNGRTHLQEYRDLLGLSSDPPEVYSREVSLYNGEGGPPQTDIPEVYSREVSLYNGEGGPPQTDIPEVYSREVSLYNGEGASPLAGAPPILDAKPD
jgi:hypothetical protein